MSEKLNSTWTERLHNYLHPTTAEVCLNTYRPNYCTDAEPHDMYSAYKHRVLIVVQKVLVASLKITHLSDTYTALSIVNTVVKVVIYVNSAASIGHISNII